MRYNILKKALFYSTGLLILLFSYNYIYLYTIYNKHTIEKNSLRRDKVPIGKVEEEDGLKYILEWTSDKTVPFVYLGKGRERFIERNCTFTNCIVTADRNYLGDYTKFDVILFSLDVFKARFIKLLPKKRSPHQKYVFGCIESASNYPSCSRTFDYFFNWTWTYRLDSNALWGYLAIRDAKNNVIGPKEHMHWIKSEDMNPVSDDIKKKIKTKTKAVAWFVSSCVSESKREFFVFDLQNQLRSYNLKIDIYGGCGSLNCTDEFACGKIIEKDYYFYLSLENSFAEDYVTEKLLHALQNYAVPIVYGGANYSRFMPDGIYLNARKLGAPKVASIMNELIKNPDQYAEYFRWKYHYSYHKRWESIETDDYCKFCAMLNNKNLVDTISVYEDFKGWWDPPYRCHSLPQRVL